MVVLLWVGVVCAFSACAQRVMLATQLEWASVLVVCRIPHSFVMSPFSVSTLTEAEHRIAISHTNTKET